MSFLVWDPWRAIWADLAPFKGPQRVSCLRNRRDTRTQSGAACLARRSKATFKNRSNTYLDCVSCFRGYINCNGWGPLLTPLFAPPPPPSDFEIKRYESTHSSPFGWVNRRKSNDNYNGRTARPTFESREKKSCTDESFEIHAQITVQAKRYSADFG